MPHQLCNRILNPYTGSKQLFHWVHQPVQEITLHLCALSVKIHPEFFSSFRTKRTRTKIWRIQAYEKSLDDVLFFPSFRFSRNIRNATYPYPVVHPLLQLYHTQNDCTRQDGNRAIFVTFYYGFIGMPEQAIYFLGKISIPHLPIHFLLPFIPADAGRRQQAHKHHE